MRNERDAALVAFCAWFSSPLWFYGRTFFTEPYTVSFAIFAIAAIVARRYVVASLLLALTIAMKETGAILVVAILVGCVRPLGLRRTLVLTIGPLLFGVAFAVKNLLVVGTPFSTYQPFAIGDPLEGAIGLLVDAGHGLLWFAPLLTIAAAGWVRRSRLVPADLSMAALLAFAGYYAVSAAWTGWDGGSCYGPRLLVPALPALIVPLVALFDVLGPRARHALVAPLFVAGFVVNWTAAADPFTAFWGIAIPPLLAKNLPVAILGVPLGATLYWLIATKFTVPPGQRWFSRSSR
ncbi:MAG: hypothetical protein ACRD2J_02910 [Thermoanaerobaculia bacterium]